jgi:hypothetical protein
MTTFRLTVTGTPIAESYLAAIDVHARARQLVPVLCGTGRELRIWQGERDGRTEIFPIQPLFIRKL